MEDQISAEQSLNIINNAISKTKENLREHSFGFILWGWLVMGTSLLHYAIIKLYYFENCWIVWPIVMGIGALYSIYHFSKREKKKAYTTYLDNFLTVLWQTTFISFVMAFFLAYRYHFPATAVMLTLCGLSTVTTGKVMKYKPLIYGGFSFFVFAILSTYVYGAENLLINAVSIFVGYLIPGHLLSKK